MKKLSLLITIFLFLTISTFAQEKPNFDSKLPDKIKAVFDWSIPPEDTATALRFVSNFIKAYDEFNPAGEYQLAIVSHGPEALIFSKKNYEQYQTQHQSFILEKEKNLKSFS
jgi:hypothetical protein